MLVSLFLKGEKSFQKVMKEILIITLNTSIVLYGT